MSAKPAESVNLAELASRRYYVIKNIVTIDAGKYSVSAGGAINDGREIGIYEIIISDRRSGAVWEIRSNKYNRQSVQEVTKAIAHLVGILEEHYTPEWCKEHFT